MKETRRAGPRKAPNAKVLSPGPVGWRHVLFLASACGHLHEALSTRDAHLSLGIDFVPGLDGLGRVDGWIDWLIDCRCMDLSPG